MNLVTEKPQMVFRKDFDGRALYSIGLSKKKQDGSYDKTYMPVQFKKSIVLDNQTLITIKNAWLTFYKNKENKPVYYIFVSEFEEAKETQTQEKETQDPFEEFANEIQDENLDLPF